MQLTFWKSCSNSLYKGLDLQQLGSTYSLMSSKIKHSNGLQGKSTQSPISDLEQFLKYPKTCSPKKITNMKIPVQKSVQSVVVLVAQQNDKRCAYCNKLKQKIEEIKFIGLEVSYLKERNEQFLEQIELLSSNFMYILQLGVENIAKGLKSRVQNILRQKQKIIEKQVKIIERLENQNEILINKIDNGVDLNEKIVALQEKVKFLQNQNANLRQITQNYKNKQDSQSIQIHSIPDQDDQNPKQFLTKDSFFGSQRIKMTLDRPIGQFGVKKRKTLQMQINKQKDQCQTEQMRSLDNLRIKIKEIKSKIINQNF